MKTINLIIFSISLSTIISAHAAFADIIVDDFEGAATVIDGGWGCIGCTSQIISGDGFESNRSLRLQGGTSGFGGISIGTLSQSERDISRFRAISYRFKNINNPANNDNPEENQISIKFIFGNGSEWEEPPGSRVLLSSSNGEWIRVLIPFDTEGTGFLRQSGAGDFDLSNLTRMAILLSPQQNSNVNVDNIELIEPKALSKIVIDAPQRVYTPISGALQFDTASGFEVGVTGVDSSGLRVISPITITLSESTDILTLKDSIDAAVDNLSFVLDNGTRKFNMEAVGADKISTTLSVLATGGVSGLADIQIRSSSEGLDELDFVLGLINSDSGLVRSEIDGTSATLYVNALAVIMFTHAETQGYIDNGFDYAKQIIGKMNKQQFDQVKDQNGNVVDHELKGAFTSSFDINTGKNNTGDNISSERIRNGNNAWYLLALSYYTIITDDNSFVSNIKALADYLTIRGQQNETEIDGRNVARTFGAIKHGFNLPATENSGYMALENITTEHQNESYAGLLYASKISAIEFSKRQTYAESARKIFEFTFNSLYNPNHQSLVNPTDISPFFHTGLTDLEGAVNPAFPPSMDAQTWTYLAFGNRFRKRFCTDISDVLDYAKNQLFSSGQVSGQAFDGGVWYNGDSGIWLEGMAQLGLAFLVASNESGGSASDVDNANDVFDTQSKMQKSDGGLQTFSDGYIANTESAGNQTRSAAVTTVWRYFHAENFNPFDVANVVSNSSIIENQQIILNKGWNQISFNVLPLDPTPLGLFSELIANNQLDMVVSEIMNFSPDYPCELNSLSLLDAGKGHWVKVKMPTNLAINGTQLNPLNYTISLKPGWNHVAYILSNPMDIKIALAGLINVNDLDSSNLQLVIFEGKKFNPRVPDSENSLTELTPGAGCWINVEFAHDLSFPAL